MVGAGSPGTYLRPLPQSKVSVGKRYKYAINGWKNHSSLLQHSCRVTAGRRRFQTVKRQPSRHLVTSLRFCSEREPCHMHVCSPVITDKHWGQNKARWHRLHAKRISCLSMNSPGRGESFGRGNHLCDVTTGPEPSPGFATTPPPHPAW